MCSQIVALALAASLSVSLSTARTMQDKESKPAAQIQPAAEGFSLQVLNPSGAVVANASVLILSDTSARVIHANTNDVGQLRIADLATGSYFISISAIGFKDLRLIHAAVPSRQVVTLELGSTIIIDDPSIPEVPLKSSPIPTQLSEPSSGVPVPPGLGSSPPMSSKPTDSTEHRNVLRRFLSKLGRVL
jgi:Carboxypeptidase regulatory-like domain